MGEGVSEDGKEILMIFVRYFCTAGQIVPSFEYS